MSIFSLFQRIHAQITNANINYYGQWSENSSETQTKKSSHDLLEIISAASRATPFANRFSARLPLIFLLVILLSFSRSFFSSSSFVNSTRTGRDRTCHRSPLHPRRRHARLSTALGPVPFFCRGNLLYPSTSEGVLRCPFPDLYVRVHRPFSSPFVRRSFLFLSLIFYVVGRLIYLTIREKY